MVGSTLALVIIVIGLNIITHFLFTCPYSNGFTTYNYRVFFPLSVSCCQTFDNISNQPSVDLWIHGFLLLLYMCMFSMLWLLIISHIIVLPSPLSTSPDQVKMLSLI